MHSHLIDNVTHFLHQNSEFLTTLPVDTPELLLLTLLFSDESDLIFGACEFVEVVMYLSVLQWTLQIVHLVLMHCAH